MHRILLIFWLAKKLVYTAVRLLTHNFVIAHADLPSFCVSVLVCVCVCVCVLKMKVKVKVGSILLFPS